MQGHYGFRELKLKSALFVPDTHAPFHDRRAWGLMLKVGKAIHPHYLRVIGDLADFYAVSSHSKSPDRTHSLEQEVDDVHACLDDLDALGAKDKEFIAGNHEDRLTRYLQDKAPELFGLVSIPDLLKLKARGWGYIGYKDYSKLGKLHLTHDVGASGRNATFRALDTFQHSNVTGHSHRMQYIVEGNAVGEYKVAAQFGWLGDRKKIDYMHRAKVNKDWALGFGVGYVSDAGIAYLTPVPIIQVKGAYTCVVNGSYFEN